VNATSRGSWAADSPNTLSYLDQANIIYSVQLLLAKLLQPDMQDFPIYVARHTCNGIQYAVKLSINVFLQLRYCSVEEALEYGRHGWYTDV
jgi:hypothetical protein